MSGESIDYLEIRGLLVILWRKPRNVTFNPFLGERHLKSEISNLQVEKSVLESRISGLLSTRASEKVWITDE